MKHTHLIGSEDLRSQDHKEIVQDRMEGNSFVIREVPIYRLNVGQCDIASSDLSGFSEGNNFSAGKNIMDYDRPELVVFLQEDHQQFVNDICIDRGASTKGKCLLECELDHSKISCLFDPEMKSNSDSNVGTMETVSSNSNGSECASQDPCSRDVKKKYGFRNLMMEGEVELDSGYENSTYHPTKKTTSEALREVFNKEADFSGSFKNWQINSILGTIGSRVKFPHCADCQQFPEATSMFRPEMGNSQSLTGSDKRFDRQADYPGETSSCGVGPLSGPTSYTVPPTKSDSASHQSNDSISSTHSFTFPILPPEWKGSPVRMLEADRRQSRKHQWRKICFPCCKF